MRLPVLIICVCYLVLILTDCYILSDIRKFSIYSKFLPPKGFKKHSSWWKIYLIFSILVLALLTVAICIPKKSETVGVVPIMWMLYIVITIELAQLAYVLFSLVGYIPVFFRKRRWNTGLWVGFPMAVLVFSIMWWGTVFGRYKIHVQEVVVSSSDIPAGFNGYKIAQISDLHVGTWGNDTLFIHNLIDSVNNLHPDLVVFTGDIVNRESSELKPFIKTLKRISAPDGVYAILGNHDYGDYIAWESNSSKAANLDSLKAYHSEMNWKLIDNQYTDIFHNGDSIVLVGVGNWGEPPFTKYGNLEEAYPKALRDKDKFVILLSHNPEHWNQEVGDNEDIDLTLSGHTHAMQIMVRVGDWCWSPAQYKYKQWGGLYERETQSGFQSKLYVNIGAGEVGLPMRIGASPEITVFTLRKN